MPRNLRNLPPVNYNEQYLADLVFNERTGSVPVCATREPVDSSEIVSCAADLVTLSNQSSAIVPDLFKMSQQSVLNFIEPPLSHSETVNLTEVHRQSPRLNISSFTEFSDLRFEDMSQEEVEERLNRREIMIRKLATGLTSELLLSLSDEQLGIKKQIISKHENYLYGVGDYALLNEFAAAYEKVEELMAVIKGVEAKIVTQMNQNQQTSAQRTAEAQFQSVMISGGSRTTVMAEVHSPNLPHFEDRNSSIPRPSQQNTSLCNTHFALPTYIMSTSSIQPIHRSSATIHTSQGTSNPGICLPQTSMLQAQSHGLQAPHLFHPTLPMNNLMSHHNGWQRNQQMGGTELRMSNLNQDSRQYPSYFGQDTRYYQNSAAQPQRSPEPGRPSLMISMPKNALEVKLNTTIRTVELIISQNINEKSTEAVLTSVMITDIPKLENIKTSADMLLQMMMKNEALYSDAILRLTTVLDLAEAWINNSLMLIKGNQLDVPEDNKNIVEPIKLKPFSGWKSDTNVFDFFEDFKKILGTSKLSVQATALYKNYLDADLQKEVEHIKNDFGEMVKYFTKRYGDARRIVAAKKRLLEGLKYHPKDMEVQIKYFRSFSQVLQNLKALLSEHQINVEDLGNELFNQAFLKTLSGYLPEYHRKKFRKVLSKAERRSHSGRITDQEEYDLLHEYIHDEMLDLEDYVTDHGKEEKKQEPLKDDKSKKAAIHVVADAEEQSCNLVNQSAVQHQPKETKNWKPKQQESSYGKKATVSKAASKKVIVKCPMHDILADYKSHPAGSCSDFMKAKPKDRAEQIKKFRICQTCLGDWCGQNKEECCNKSKVPDELICITCAKSDEKRPKNVLLCNGHQKDFSKIAHKLDYLPGYVPSSRFQLTHVEATKSTDDQTEQFDTDSREALAYNVTNGYTASLETLEESELIPPTKEQSIYMLQMLRIAGMDCLTMYDSGSSGEAIKGDFAEAANFKVVNPNNQQINVAGGLSISTGFGVYEAVIGPLASGKYTTKRMIGLKQITHNIPQFDLSTINQELKSDFPMIGSEILPPEIGGQSVQLLIGIRSSELMPEKLLELPNGLMVFRAKIKDKHGSSIMYGGPHRTFNQMQSDIGSMNFNFLNATFSELHNAYIKSPVSGARSFNFVNNMLTAKDDQIVRTESEFIETVNDNFSLKLPQKDMYFPVSPTPVEQIVREVQTSPNLPDCSKTVSDKTDIQNSEENAANSETLICECCGNPGTINLDKVPRSPYKLNGLMNANPETIAQQFRQIVETDFGLYKMRKPNKPIQDLEEEEKLLVYNYRCAVCQKCQTCLSADKTKLVSVRDEEEDKIIQQCIRWDQENKLMYCSYPFIQDPETSLKKIWGKDTNETQVYTIFQQQRRKPLSYRKGILDFHEELKERGFVTKVACLNKEQQSVIETSNVKHFLPWRAVFRMDSISTPCRMVTDPSITQFNKILAKGKNQLSNLYGMLVNFRVYKHAYAFDISKMYNALRLEDNMLPYSLYYEPNVGSI